jgi:hypothetical protein
VDEAAPKVIAVPVNPDARNAVSSATVSLEKLVSWISPQFVGGVVVVSAEAWATRVGLVVSADWLSVGAAVPAA